LPAGQRLPRRGRPVHDRRRLLRFRRSSGRFDDARDVRCQRAVDGRRLSEPDGVQAGRRRLQAQDRVVQLIVRLLQRQLRDAGYLQAGQRRRAAMRAGSMRRGRRGVCVERKLLRQLALRAQRRRRRGSPVRVRRDGLHRGVRLVHQQRGLLPGDLVCLVLPRDPGRLRAVQRGRGRRRTVGQQRRHRSVERQRLERRGNRHELRSLRAGLLVVGPVLQRHPVRRPLRVPPRAVSRDRGTRQRRMRKVVCMGASDDRVPTAHPEDARFPS
jgi:hypothetical protein